MRLNILAILFFGAFCSCRQPVSKLPILGDPIINGRDTIYPTIARFSLIDQDSETISNQTFDNKIYVADFIFLSCPSICPKMTGELNTVYKAYANDERVQFISHTIDPERDSVSRLKLYAENLGVSSDKWHFVTGNKDSIYSLANNSYFSAAFPDSTAPGGFAHSGAFLLIDKNRHIRGVYNSTKDDETQRLINDIRILLKEQF